MNLHNDRMARNLAKAIIAIKQLDAQGCTVVDVSIANATPLIRIDGTGTEGLKGVQARSITISGVTHRTLVVMVEDCRVEWSESFLVAREAQRA